MRISFCIHVVFTNFQYVFLTIARRRCVESLHCRAKDLLPSPPGLFAGLPHALESRSWTFYGQSLSDYASGCIDTVHFISYSIMMISLLEPFRFCVLHDRRALSSNLFGGRKREKNWKEGKALRCLQTESAVSVRTV